MSAETITFDNHLEEAKYAFHARDDARAKDYLYKALAIVARREQEKTPVVAGV